MQPVIAYKSASRVSNIVLKVKLNFLFFILSIEELQVFRM